MRKVRGDGRKPPRITTNTPKGLVKQRSSGFPTAKNGSMPGSNSLGGNPNDYARKSMMGSGIMDGNGLRDGGKMLDDSSDSDSDSSNSSVRSNPNLGANSLNKQSFSHAPPHLGGPGGLN